MIKTLTRQAFQKHLQRRFSLRLHMCFILLATTLSGALFAKILLVLGVADFRIRYPLSVVLSYLIFFLCIRLWLCCISSRRSGTDILDWVAVPLPSGRGAGGGAVPPLRGGGGQFSGAGASGSFEGPDVAAVETRLAMASKATPPDSPSDGIGGAVGDAASTLADDHVIVAVIALVVLIATTLASALSVLYGAPTILAEAAFEGVLAASLIQRTRSISDKAWAGSIFKATWKPFAAAVGVAFFSGVALHSYFPEAVRLADILVKN